MKTEPVYGRTPIGQMVYDFGIAKLTDKWLAQKYDMPIANVRTLKRRTRAALNDDGPRRRRKRRR